MMRMSSLRTGLVVLACIAAIPIAAGMLGSPPAAASTACALIPGQQIGCSGDAMCTQLGAVCDSVTNLCICPARPPTCLLVGGQLISCIEDAECDAFDAVCDPNAARCVCPTLLDGSVPGDAATPITPPRVDGGGAGLFVPPASSGGYDAPPKSAGCDFVGR